MFLRLYQTYRPLRYFSKCIFDSGPSVASVFRSPGRLQTFPRFYNAISTSARQFSTASWEEQGDFTVILPHTPFSKEENLEKSTKEEIRDTKILLDMIIEKLRDRGTDLVLPDSYLQNLDESSLGLFLTEGPTLKMNYIADAFALRPKFFEIPTWRWAALVKTFGDAELSAGILLAAAVGHPKILELDARDINKTLIELNNLGIRDRALSAVVAKRPQVLSSDINKISTLIENLHSFFPRAKLAILIRRDPDVLFMDFEELEAKYEYIYYSMGLEPIDVYRSRKWHRLLLSEIECRHQFLVRAGVYIMPDEKKVEVGQDNPRLDVILDSEDEEFCRLANVSLLEWETFKKIYEKDEPYEPEELTYAYLKRTGRVAPKEKGKDDEWEDVQVEEMVEDEKTERQRPDLKARSKMKKRGKGGLEIDATEIEIEKESVQRYSSRMDRRRNTDEEVRSEKQARKSDAESHVYARALNADEMAELRARIQQLKLKAAGGGYVENEDDEESGSDDEEYQKYEARRLEMERNKKKMRPNEKLQFRKRGVFLASDD